MDEQTFNALADAMLARIESALEKCTADFDYEFLAGGVIELDFDHAGGSKIIINRHSAAQEIWIAARSGGYHFRPVADGTLPESWLGTRDGMALMTRLSLCMSEQAGERIALNS
ncbi:MAG: iron donor protein CyaY [Sterolibacterium sp.]|nr:iron donor protein CyaY [Sterolibacterium sp.]